MISFVGKLLLLFIFVARVFYGTAEYCSAKKYPKCPYHCHCAFEGECKAGLCPFGCEDGWTGRGCQIGNLALRRTAEERWFGFISIYLGPHDYNVTTVGLSMNLADQYSIFVTKGREMTYCGDIITSEVKCSTETFGNTVMLARKGDNPVSFEMKDIVITGHRIMDCSTCDAGVPCNRITGCDSCTGTYQPDCRISIPIAQAEPTHKAVTSPPTDKPKSKKTTTIAIVVPLLIITCILIGVVLVMRRKKKKATSSNSPAGKSNNGVAAARPEATGVVYENIN